MYQTLSQPYEAPVMLLAGVIMGIAALLIELSRKLMSAGVLLSALSDALTGMTCAVIACGFLTHAVSGAARAYHFALMLIGFMLMYFTVSKPAKKALRAVSRALNRVGKSRFFRILLK